MPTSRVEPEHNPLALTLALTGIRYGEATALRWSDIDEVGGAIRIERAQWHGIVGETKTGNVRTVPVDGGAGGGPSGPLPNRPRCGWVSVRER